MSGLEDSLQCGVCFEKFAETGQHIPLMLACGHTFCSTCVTTLPEKKCPFCLKIIEANVNTLPRNLTLLSLISGFNSLLASQQEQKELDSLPLPPLVPVSSHLIRSSSDSSTSSNSSSNSSNAISNYNVSTGYVYADCIPFEDSLKPLSTLTIDEVQSLLESSNLNKFKSAFLENEVDGETLCECFTPEDLKDLGITVGPVE